MDSGINTFAIYVRPYGKIQVWIICVSRMIYGEICAVAYRPQVGKL
jgi:hypothetical protein